MWRMLFDLWGYAKSLEAQQKALTIERRKQMKNQKKELIKNICLILKMRKENLEQRISCKEPISADAKRLGCPPLDADMLRDGERGLWELWPEGQERQDSENQVRSTALGMARDPRGDIQKHVPVCIDFGTSSTVVALRENGRRRLLRAGITDWNQPAEASHFENPTVLQFADAVSFGRHWKSEPWRPHFSTCELKSSHQAREELRSSASSSLLSSTFCNIKTWAFQENILGKISTSDQQSQPFVLSSCDSGEDVPCFDPVEIYAFYLGLSINSQYWADGRIYHDYWLSFPVKFDSVVRERIRAAFERGLKRSLPASLGTQPNWEEKTPFRVREGADEPAAYAAAWLAHKLEHDEDFQKKIDEPDFPGLFCGVFDFGGGTTDFTFLLCRPSTDEEISRHRWDIVLELLDSDGDHLLGGEHLLHLLAVELIKDGASFLRSRQIPFLPPLEGHLPSGMERLFHRGMKARINTQRICEALRPLWEEGPNEIDPEKTGTISLMLLNENGDEIQASLPFDADKCMDLLKARIRTGVDAFFTAAMQTIKSHDLGPETLHIRLAGNSCRSPLVQECFHDAINSLLEKYNSLKPESFKLEPFPENTHLEELSLKNGVALGLLELVDGEGMGLVRRSSLKVPGQAFQFAFGTFRRGRLQPLLTRYATCNEWQKTGLRVTEGLVDTFGFVRGPEALEGKALRQDCREFRHEWSAEDDGKCIMVRFTGPCTVELCALNDGDQPDEAHSFCYDLALM